MTFGDAAPQTFAERFALLADGMHDGELMQELGLTLTPIRKLQSGATRTIKLDGGLKLCAKRGVSPYWLAGLPEPPHHMDVELDGVRLAISAPALGGDHVAAQAVRHTIADALRGIGADVTERDRAQPQTDRAQELEERNAALEKRNAALEGRIEALEKRNARIAVNTPRKRR